MAKPLAVGARVSVKDKEEEYGPGTLRFIGTTKFATGEWVGIELDSPTGKNDGSVQGDKYFSCKPKHGVFVKTPAVVLWDAYEKEKGKKTGAAAAPAPAAPATVASPPTTAAKKASSITSPTVTAKSTAAAKATTSTAPATRAASGSISRTTSTTAVPAARATSPTPTAPVKAEPAAPAAAAAAAPAVAAPQPVTAPAPTPATEPQNDVTEELIRIHSEEKVALEEKIETLQAEFVAKEKEYTSALDKLAAHLATLTARNKELETSLNEFKVKADDLTSLLEEATDQEELISQQKTELEAEMATLRTELEQEKHRLVEQVQAAEARASAATAASFERQLQDKQKQIEELNAAVAAASESSSAAAELAESASKMTALRAEMEQLRSQYEREINAMKQQLETEKAELTDRLGRAHDEALKRSDSAQSEKLHEIVAAHAQEKSEMSAKITQLQRDLDEAAQRASDSLAEQLSKIEALSKQLEEEKVSSKAALEKARQEFAAQAQRLSAEESAKGSEIASIRAALEAAEKANASLRAEVDTLKASAAAASDTGDAAAARASQLVAEVSSLKNQLEEMKSALSIAESGMQDATKLAQDSEEIIEDLQRKCADAEEKALKTAQAYESQLAELRSELQKATEEAAIARSSAASAAAAASAAPVVAQYSGASEADIAALKAQFEEQIANLNDSLEMATVDKELAESQLEQLQAEVVAPLRNQLAQQQQLVAQLQQQVAAASPAAAPMPSLAELGADSDTGLAVALEQNAQLTEALLKLRSFAEQAQLELTRLQNEVVPNLELAKMNLEEKVLDYEDRMEELKQTVEDSKGLQDQLEQLFEKKMDLEEENKSLKETVENLQQMGDLAEETEEQHQALEKRLQAELHSKQVEVLDKEGVVWNLNLALQEKSTLVSRLESFVNELQQRVLRHAEESAVVSATDADASNAGASNADAELHSLLRQQASREAVKALREALASLDVQQALLQNRLFRLFVPEAAIKADHDAASLLLLVKRLAFKSNLALHHLHRQFSLDKFERNVDEIDSFYRYLWQLTQLIRRFEFFAAQIADTLQSCDEDTYWKLAKLVYELTPYEKKMDHILSLIEREEIRIDQPSLEDLHIVLDRFSLLVEKFADPKKKSDSSSVGRYVAHLLREAGSNSRSIVYAIKQSVVGSSSVGVSMNRFKILQDLLRKAARLMVVPVENSVAEYSLRTIAGLPSDVFEQVQIASNLIAALLVVIESSAKQLQAKLAENPSAGSVADLFDDIIRNALSTSSDVASLFHQVFEAANARSETCPAVAAIVSSEPLCALDKYYDIIHKLVVGFEDELSRGVYDVEPEASAPASAPSTPAKARPSSAASTPLKGLRGTENQDFLGVCARYEEHARAIRSDLESTLELKNSTSGMQAELNEKEAALQQRSKTIEDLQWKCKKVEHRVSQLEKELAEQSSSFDSEKQRLISSEKSKEEQVFAQARQLDSLNQTIKGLQEQVAKLEVENQALESSAGANKTAAAEQAAGGISIASAEQIKFLRESIAHLMAENRRLRTEYDRQRLLRDLPPLVAKPIASLLNPTSDARKAAFIATNNAVLASLDVSKTAEPAKQTAAPPAPAKLPSVSKKVTEALQAVIATAALPKMVDLSDKASPIEQAKTIAFEHRRLRTAVAKIETEAIDALVNGRNISREAISKQLRETTTVVNNVVAQPIARLTLPSLLETKSTATINMPAIPKLTISKADFENIHTAFIQMDQL